MASRASVFLIGPMGSGKTTIGRMLAQELQFEFVDSDKYIEERCGANIPWIFDVEGEDGFRERERQAIATLTERVGIVLATGGGAILSEQNRNNLSQRGMVIYLRTSVEQQFARTSKDKNRPLLQTADPKQVLSDLFAFRDPLYQQTADVILETDQRNPRWVVNEIKRQFKAKYPHDHH